MKNNPNHIKVSLKQTRNNQGCKVYMKVITPIILIVLIVVSFKNLIDPNIYTPSSLEADMTFTRQEYLGNGLGKIYKNRFGVTFFNKVYPVLMKFESNLFSDLGNGFVFVPLFGYLVYSGLKKFNEKK